jgi:arylsulfatase A
VTETDYGPDLLHAYAVDFIARYKDKPFFLYYPMVSVHAPILRTPDGAGGNLFAKNVAYLDRLVGKLVSELDRLNLREKTLIVFTGDNGLVGGGSVHGRAIDGGKGSMKEGGSRVPLIASWKGTTPAGQVCRDLIDFSDFLPTFAEMAGAPLPPGVTIDGRSFAAQLQGRPGQPREWVYVQLGQRHYVRDVRWKLYGDGTLCDLKDAPFAELNLPADKETEESQAARRRLQAALDALRPAGEGGTAPGRAKRPLRSRRLDPGQQAR